MNVLRYCQALFIIVGMTIQVSAQLPPPTLEDFWEGRAEWIVDIMDVGLPMGESDTVSLGDDTYMGVKSEYIYF